jgi:predicted transcriptional regulator
MTHQIPDDNKRQHSIYLTDAAWDAIEAMAAPKGYSKSELIEQAVRQQVKLQDVLPARDLELLTYLVENS